MDKTDFDTFETWKSLQYFKSLFESNSASLLYTVWGARLYDRLPLKAHRAENVQLSLTEI